LVQKPPRRTGGACDYESPKIQGFRTAPRAVPALWVDGGPGARGLPGLNPVIVGGYTTRGNEKGPVAGACGSWRRD